MSSTLKEIYQGNACDLFDRIKNSTLVGTQKKECSEIYGGIFTRNFGLGMTKHFDTMDSIRAKFDYYIRTPVPTYQGSTTCQIPAQLPYPMPGWMMQRCTSREEEYHDFSKQDFFISYV